MILLSLLLAAVQPSAEALALGRQLSEKGTLATLLAVGERKDLAEMKERNPGMSDTDEAALEATVKRVYAAGRDKLFSADARSFATNLDIADLRALAAFAKTPAATHLREKMPAIIVSTISQVGQIDLGAAIRKDYCRGREKQPLCAK
jgi:hypothetical protein